MYDDKINKSIIDNLESKALSIVNTSVALASQGYLINKSKVIRLNWSAILLHAFENIDILNKEQQHNLETLYNKVNTI